MILEKLSNRMNPKIYRCTNIDSHGNWKQTRSFDKIESVRVGVEGRLEGEMKRKRGGLRRT